MFSGMSIVMKQNVKVELLKLLKSDIRKRHDLSEREINYYDRYELIISVHRACHFPLEE